MIYFTHHSFKSCMSIHNRRTSVSLQLVKETKKTFVFQKVQLHRLYVENNVNMHLRG